MTAVSRLIIASSILTLLLAATLQADSKLQVFTVNYPHAYFAERNGGGLVELVFPAPEDIDPAFWTPDERTIGDYQKADLFTLFQSP